MNSPSQTSDQWIDPTRPETLRMPKPNFSTEPGIGTEIEFAIVDKDGSPLNTLGGVNTARRIILAARKQLDEALAERMWCEEAAWHMEAISGVHQSFRAAVEDAMRLVDFADSVAQVYGGRAVLTPIPENRFVFALSPNPRAATLLDDPSWAERPHDTGILSTQFNIAHFYIGCNTPQEYWERTLYLMNSFKPEDIQAMRKHDSLTRNWKGDSRLTVLRDLIPGEEKWAAFKKHGFTNPDHVLYPPKFKDVQHMMSWLLGHGKQPVGGSIEKMDNGMVHAGILKPKWGSVSMAEYRIMGSMGSNTDEVLTHMSPVTSHYERVMGELGL